MPAFVTANFVALLVTAVANTALNRRLTFKRPRCEPAAFKAQASFRGSPSSRIGLGLTSRARSSSCTELHALNPKASGVVEIIVRC